MQNCIFSLSNLDTIFGNEMNDFAIKINFGINRKSKLFQNRETGSDEWIVKATNELEKLYPELEFKDISFKGDYGHCGNQSAPGYSGYLSFQKTGVQNQIMELTFIITAGKFFDFDTRRLQNTDLFSCFDIQKLYAVTIFEKK